MITCILVGGNSQRFKDAGYGTHKAILPLEGSIDVLDEVLYNLPKKKVIISARFAQYEALAQKLNRLSMSWATLSWSHSIARGPIYGILDASEYLDVDEPVIVSYCDCWVKGGIDDLVKQWREMDEDEYDSGAVMFESDDPRFGYWSSISNSVESYNRLGGSRMALSGIFYFTRGKDLVRHAFEIAQPNKGIVHLLNQFTNVISVDKDRIVDVGTPESYEAYLKSNG